MDSCVAVEKELEKVSGKFSGIDKQAATALQEALTSIEKVKQEITQGSEASDTLSPSQAEKITECIKKVKEIITKISSDHKDLHSCVSRVGKAIDKNFLSDFDSLYVESAFEGEENRRQIDLVICEHFLKHGMLDIVESLDSDCGSAVDVGEREPFLQVHHILESLKSRNLQPALEWAQANSERLLAQGSSLEFKLHKLYFVELVRQGESRQWEAIEYAKNFSRFANTHKKELQVLMGSLLYIKNGLVGSPYEYLLDRFGWDEICDVFTKDACTLLGLSVGSPLSIVIKAGCAALPPLLTIKQVMQQRQCSGVWTAKDELPVEIDLGDDCRFHSIFACPILRQQCTESNPPVRLVCGHVISREALNKLANVNKWAILPNPIFHKVKCPYCPIEQSPGDARQIFF